MRVADFLNRKGNGLMERDKYNQGSKAVMIACIIFIVVMLTIMSLTEIVRTCSV